MRPIITLREVTFARQRQGRVVDVLDGISFDVFEGETVGVMGRSGVGKSTVVNLIAGYLVPTAGEIVEQGRAVLGPSTSRIVVFQAGGLWPWLSLERNVALGLGRKRHDPHSARILDELLERLGIAEVRSAYPSELSGGMQKRAELARAVLARPRVLMLDEALSSVDSATKEVCIDVIHDFCRDSGGAVLLVSHDIDEVVRTANRIVCLVGSPAKINSTIVVPDLLHRNDDRLRADILAAFGYFR